MNFTLHECMIMHAYGLGYDEGVNNRRPLNPHGENSPQFEAYDLGYAAGQNTRHPWSRRAK